MSARHGYSRLVLAIGLAACTPDAPQDASPPADAGEARGDSAGVRIVDNGRKGTLGPLALEETLRLGTADIEGPEQFSDVRAVALDEGGGLYVGNNGSGTVRAFDADGALRVEFAGRGEGPGEIPGLLNEVVVLGDTVAVVDWQRRGRILLFSRDGEFLAGQAVRAANGTAAYPVRRVADGWLWLSTPAFPTPAPGERLDPTREVVLRSFGPNDPGTVAFTLPVRAVYGVGEEGHGEDWRFFEPSGGHWGFSENGRLYLTRTDSYRIDVFDRAGLVRSIRREFEPRRITPDDVEDLRREALATIDTLPIPEAMRPEQREMTERRMDVRSRLPLPDVLEPFGGLLVSADGSFWVEVREDVSPVESGVDPMFGSPLSVPDHETRWDLFDAEGVYLGQVLLPARFRPEAASGLDVVGVQTDALDIEYVVRYRATPADPG